VEVREIMEPEIAALAATRATEMLVTNMQAAYDAMERAQGNSEAFIEADLSFHRALAEATQNPLIPILMDSIIELLREEGKQRPNVEIVLKRGQIHHRKILEAVMNQDAKAARLAMVEHLAQIRADMSLPVQSPD